MAGEIRRRGAYEQSRVEQRKIDTRGFWSKVASDLDRSDGVITALMLAMGLVMLAFVVPMLGMIILLPLYILSRKYAHPRLRLHNFPFRVPAHLKVPDGSKKDFSGKGAKLSNLNAFKAEGTQYWGYALEDRMQVWASVGDLKTHMTILGGTGSGKTELLYTLTINQLVQDSGFIYVDAKGDIALQDRMLEQLRRFDRHEDLLTISFAAGKRDLAAEQKERVTNTFNIMSSSSDSMLIEIISGMVSSSETGADMWEGRCLAFVAALTRPLVFMRNRGLIDLAASTYMEHMELAVVEELVFGNHPEESKGIDRTLDALKTFLISLPGYQQAKKGRQDQKTNEQFGFIAMQLTRVFNDLGHNYGHIFNSKVGEIDISDVVLNRRCLTILLPALERSSSTLTMLGKLIMGSVKQMMAGSLGASVEGVRRLNVDARPTNAVNVFRVILDEVGYIMVPGMSITTAQARSLNISMTFAAQTFSDLKRGNAIEAEGIWDNTSLKLIGTLMGGEEQSSETWQKVLGMAGHVQEAVVSGYNRKNGALNIKYQASEHISVQRTARIELEYLRSLQGGEFILFGSKKRDGSEGENMMVPLQVMHVSSEIKSVEMRVNDLIPVTKAGMRVDDSEAKNTLKELLKHGQLLDKFQEMALSQGSESESAFPALQMFSNLSEKSVAQTKQDNIGLALTFYKNLFKYVYTEKGDKHTHEAALRENNINARAEEIEDDLTGVGSMDTLMDTLENESAVDTKRVYDIDSAMQYQGTNPKVAEEYLEEDEEVAVVNDVTEFDFSEFGVARSSKTRHRGGVFDDR